MDDGKLKRLAEVEAQYPPKTQNQKQNNNENENGKDESVMENERDK